MKKEIFIAVLIGLLFGLVITYGVYRARTTLTPQSDSTSLTSSPTPTPATSTGNLAITAPEDELVTDQADLTITGTTIPNSFVIIGVNEEEPTITTADNTGNFSVTTVLEADANTIQVIAIDEDGNQVSQVRTVTYLTTSLDEPTPTPASDSAQPREDQS